MNHHHRPRLPRSSVPKTYNISNSDRTRHRLQNKTNHERISTKTIYQEQYHKLPKPFCYEHFTALEADRYIMHSHSHTKRIKIGTIFTQTKCHGGTEARQRFGKRTLRSRLTWRKRPTMGEHSKKKNVFATRDYVKKIRLVIVTRNLSSIYYLFSIKWVEKNYVHAAWQLDIYLNIKYNINMKWSKKAWVCPPPR